VRLTWDEGPAWAFRPVLGESAVGIQVRGELHRGEATAPISDPFLILADRLLVRNGTIARFEGGPGLALLAELRRSGPMDVPAAEAPVLAHALARMDVPAELLPEALRIAAVRSPPTPRLSIAAPPAGASWLRAHLEFAYDGTVIAPTETLATPFDAAGQRIIHRRPDEEARARAWLAELGFRLAWQGGREYELRPTLLPDAVRTLVGAGWHVEADGAIYRTATGVHMAVKSGIDWFDLTTTIDIG
jgi:hypothetical protein